MILSDGFDDLDALTSALRHLRHRRHEVMFFHVLAPEEQEFPFRRPARFRNLEVPGQTLRINPSSLRAAYLAKFEAFCRNLREAVRGMDAEYHRVTTDRPLEEALLDALAARSGRGRRAGV